MSGADASGVHAVDTSIVVAGFAAWHEAHGAAASVLTVGVRLPAHAALEAYSVLTRMPAPFRASPAVVREYLAATFRQSYLVLPADAVKDLVGELVALGIAGGATYDALIGATVRAAGATLHTSDRRAQLTYERLGVAVRFVSPDPRP